MKLDDILINAYNRLPIDKRTSRGLRPVRRGEGKVNEVFLVLGGNYYMDTEHPSKNEFVRRCPIHVRIGKSLLRRFKEEEISYLLFRITVVDRIRILRVELELAGKKEPILVSSTKIDDNDTLEFIDNIDLNDLSILINRNNVAVRVLTSIIDTLQVHEKEIVFSSNVRHVNYTTLIELSDATMLSVKLTKLVEDLLTKNESGIGYDTSNVVHGQANCELKNEEVAGYEPIYKIINVKDNKNDIQQISIGLAIDEFGDFVYRIVFQKEVTTFLTERTAKKPINASYIDINISTFLHLYSKELVMSSSSDNINFLQGGGIIDMLVGKIKAALFDTGYIQLNKEGLTKPISSFGFENVMTFADTDPDPLVIKDYNGLFGNTFFTLVRLCPLTNVLNEAITLSGVNARVEHLENNNCVIKIGDKVVLSIIEEKTEYSIPFILSTPQAIEYDMLTGNQINTFKIKIGEDFISTGLNTCSNTSVWDIKRCNSVISKDIEEFVTKYLSVISGIEGANELHSVMYDAYCVLKVIKILSEDEKKGITIPKIEQILKEEGYTVDRKIRRIFIPVEQRDEILKSTTFLNAILTKGALGTKPFEVIPGVEIHEFIPIITPIVYTRMSEVTKENFNAVEPIEVRVEDYNDIAKKVENADDTNFVPLLTALKITADRVGLLPTTEENQLLRYDKDGNIYIHC